MRFKISSNCELPTCHPLLDGTNYKIIAGFPEYAILDDGRVFSFWTCRFLKHVMSKRNTLYVPLSSLAAGKESRKLVDRLVAQAFITNPENKPEVNHMDGNRLNNHVSNLEWVTHSENMEHAGRTGLMPRGEGHFRSSLKEVDIIEIRKLGDSGVPYKDVAKRFNKPTGWIRKICLREAWKHVL